MKQILCACLIACFGIAVSGCGLLPQKNTAGLTPTFIYEDDPAPQPQPVTTTATPVPAAPKPAYVAQAVTPTVPRPPEGWYPWFAKKSNMTMAEFVASLEQADAQKTRVGWQAYSEDLRKHGFPVGETLPSLKAFFLSSDIQIVSCTKDILAQHNMGRTNKAGTIRDYNFHRANCYKGEQLVYHKPSGRYVFSLGCGNVLAPRTPAPPPAALTPTIICPDNKCSSQAALS